MNNVHWSWFQDPDIKAQLNLFKKSNAQIERLKHGGRDPKTARVVLRIWKVYLFNWLDHIDPNWRLEIYAERGGEK